MERGKITQIAEGEVLWTVDAFSSLKVNVWYESPDFYFAGGDWCLNIRRESPEYGYILLQLFRMGCFPPTQSVEYTFGVQDRNGDRHRLERNRKEFGAGYVSPWIPVLLLDEKMYTLTVFCHLERMCPTQDADAAQFKKELEEKTAELESVKRELGNERSELIKLKHQNEELTRKMIGIETSREKLQTLNTETEASPSESTHHRCRLHRDLKHMFLNQEDCDVTIRVKELEFKAHRIILKVRSPVFASILRADMKEKATGIVEIDDLDPSVFSDFLCFLYSDEVDNLSAENVFGLYTSADKYDVSDLRTMCVEFMKENLCVETFCDVMRLALLHCEAELIQLCTDFFIRNASKIIKTVKWQTFSAENPTQGNELFIKYVTFVEHSNK